MCDRPFPLSTCYIDWLTGWFNDHLIHLQALYVLIKQMNCKDRLVIDALLEQLSSAYNWKVRLLF